VHGEFAENEVRENFTLSEAVAIKAAVEPMLKAEAKERQTAALKQGANAPRVVKVTTRDKGRASDHVAKRTDRKRTRILPILRSPAGEIGKKIFGENGVEADQELKDGGRSLPPPPSTAPLGVSGRDVVRIAGGGARG
jgi:hypothetical protein